MTRDWGTDRSECERVDAQLESYVDDGLTAAERDDVERHVSGCAACRTELALTESVARGLRSLPLVSRVDSGSTLEESLQAPPASDRPPSREDDVVVPMPHRQVWTHPLLQAAAVLLVMSGVWLAFSEAPFMNPAMSDRPRLTGSVTGNGADVYSEAELRAAEEDLRVALSYFGGLAEKAGLVVRDDVLRERVVEPTSVAFRRLGGLGVDPAGSGASSPQRSGSGSSAQSMENDS